MHTPPHSALPLKAKLYLWLVTLVGFGLLAMQLKDWHSQSLARLGCYLAAGLLAAYWRVGSPALTGTLSVSFLFILFGIVELSLPETLVLACAITAAQVICNEGRRPGSVRAWPTVASATIAAAAGHWTFAVFATYPLPGLLRLILAATVFFLINTLLGAVGISAIERKSVTKLCREIYVWSCPYYLIGLFLAGCTSLISRYAGWPAALMILPLGYLVYEAYGLHLGCIEHAKKHVDDISALHFRTIEALALAIQAKEHTTHAHLKRMQVYAMEIGKELGLNADELEALRTASLLHDIGKLAVPEHIISKKGRLTPEEFEKLKLHPAVGAEILERIHFPYPVVPIVQSHHERWDGSGYPAGLAGAAIPIGARILAAVDCLDALSSKSLHAPGLPLDEAVKRVVRESGKSYDPQVVDVLKRRYVELEAMAQGQQQPVLLSTDLKVSRGAEPGAGFEQTANPHISPDFTRSIAAARQEAQTLFELAHELGASLSLDETLSVVAQRLRSMIPCDSIAIFVRRGNTLVPEYVAGEDFRLLSSLKITVGAGVSGWVAENGKPIINANPSVEPGYSKSGKSVSAMKSLLSIPLEGLGGILGVVSLYHAEKDAFNNDHLRVLLAISSKVALSIENALRYREAEESATIDYLTSLPNARSLFLHLDAELARARRAKAPLAVLACDIEGFKQVNDAYGHLKGDELLRAIGQGLKEVCREYDFVARMGGDEFMLVLPGLTEKALEAKCLQLRETVRDVARRICGIDECGICIGHALFLADGTDAEQLLAEADRRMYREKDVNKLRHAGAGQGWEALRVAGLK